ncbi:MAG: VTC domain-containing protein [Lachnospiraceae bacterium]|nr:VTC domain-containing protein [Lachnospiraceae bacterium]
MGTKYSAPLTVDQAQKIVDGETDWMLHSPHSLIQELYCKMRYQGMKPMTIVDYTREPFVYRPGNVRVTFDYDIRTGMRCTDFLNPDCVTVPAGYAGIILEVKWDAYLPSIIRDAIQTPGRRVCAFSKYAQCRIYD